ncbi:protein jag [bacterium]|nr:protein jag [bacterium]
MDQVTTSGKTKQAAIEKALGELGLRRSDVRVEVLEEGSRGFLGLGSKNVKVRVSKSDGEGPLPEDLDPEKVTRGILDPLGIDYKLNVRREEDSFFVKITSKKDEGLLIGRRGQTLDAIKHLVQRILTSQAGQAVAVNLEVGDYRERREEALQEKAEAVAQKVLESGKSLSLEPMTAQDRRIVHLVLADRDDLRTYTAGEGSRRRVIVALDSEEASPRNDREPVSPYEDVPDPSFRSASISSMAQPREEHEEKRRERRPRRDRDDRPRRSNDDYRETRSSDDRPRRSSDDNRETRGSDDRPRHRSEEQGGGSREPRGGGRGGSRRRGRGGDRQREEGGTRIRKTFRKDEDERTAGNEIPTKPEESREEVREAREFVEVRAEAKPERAESIEAPVQESNEEVDEAQAERRDRRAERSEARAQGRGGRRENASSPDSGPVEKPFSSDLARSVLGLDETNGGAKPPKKKRYR